MSVICYIYICYISIKLSKNYNRNVCYMLYIYMLYTYLNSECISGRGEITPLQSNRIKSYQSCQALKFVQRARDAINKIILE